MSEDWMQKMTYDLDRWTRRWHRIFLFSLWVIAANLGAGTANFMDAWSLDKPWMIAMGLWEVFLTGLMVWMTRKTYRQLRVHRCMRKQISRLIEAEKFLYLTTSPAEAALDQLLASFEELKRL